MLTSYILSACCIAPGSRADHHTGTGRGSWAVRDGDLPLGGLVAGVARVAASGEADVRLDRGILRPVRLVVRLDAAGGGALDLAAGRASVPHRGSLSGPAAGRGGRGSGRARG